MTERSADGRSEETGFRLQGLPQADSGADLRARAAVEILATQFVEELRRGERPSVETYARRFPRHAAVIRESFPVLALLEQARLQHEARTISRHMPRTFPLRRLGGCELLCELGRGGMGVVFQARDTVSDRIIACKVLPWRVSMVPEWKSRFEQEAQTAAQLRHRNIVPVFRSGQDCGYCYYTMPFVNGLSLDQFVSRLREAGEIVLQDEIARIRKHRPAGFVPTADDPEGHPSGTDVRQSRVSRSSWRSFAQIALQACDALRCAHSQDLLHNDIKPSNILLDGHGRVRITDFGVSRPAGPEGCSADHPDLPNGTLRYMAPERFTGQYDVRSDIYSLGLTLYELLTLQPAFDCSDRRLLTEQIGRGISRRPRQVRRSVPRALERIVLNCAAPCPQDRYPTAEHLHADLLRFLNGQTVRLIRSRWTSGLRRFLKRR